MSGSETSDSVLGSSRNNATDTPAPIKGAAAYNALVRALPRLRSART